MPPYLLEPMIPPALEISHIPLLQVHNALQDPEMALPYNSRPLRLIAVVIGFALILLWTTNTFLRIPFKVDPRLLQKPPSGVVSGSGFESIEALVNEESNGGSGAWGWTGNLGSDGTRKLWFFGKAGVEGEDQGYVAPQSTRKEAPERETSELTAVASTEESPSPSPWWKAATSGFGQASAAMTATDEDRFRLHATASDAVAAVATAKNAVSSRLAKSKDASEGTLEEHLTRNNASPSVAASKTHPHNEVAATSTTPKTEPPSTGTLFPTPNPLILYAFSPSDWALPNLRFFLTHALHAHANFVFILNGALPLPTDSSADFTPDPRLINATAMIAAYASIYLNVKIVKRPNTCYDLGAFAEVLLSPALPHTLNLTTTTPGSSSTSTFLYTLHKRFILLNASLRGPFIPFWSRECWSDAYLRPVDAGQRDWKGRMVKVVGTTMNCVAGRPRHLQSMMLAGDDVGMGVLLGLSGKNDEGPRRERANAGIRKLSDVGLDACPSTYDEAVNVEVSLTSLLLSHNYTVSAMMALAHTSSDYVESCTNGDVNIAAGAYEGGNLGVWETMWIKTRWGVDREGVERVSGWLDGAVGFTGGEEEVVRGRSWGVC